MNKRNKNEDSDHYGYNDSNTSTSGGIDGVPLYASDINTIVSVNRKKKNQKPKLIRKKKKPNKK